MKLFKFALAALVCVLVFGTSATAAPLTLTLQRTTVLYNEDPPGAPLPLGRTQYDAGNVLINNTKIGEYLMLKDVNAAGLNVSALTITLFLGAGDPPTVITLQGVHSFNTGAQKGSISASDVVGLAGIGFTGSTATGTLTLLFP